MGNKVITIEDNSITTSDETSTSNSSTNLEVYRDISITSKEVNGNLWLQKNVNVQAVFNALENLFTWRKGERILLPEFGTNIRYYIYEQLVDENIEQITAEIQNAVLEYEPRVKILNVYNATTTDDAENNTVRLDIIFTIPSLTDEQYNYSYICNRTD